MNMGCTWISWMQFEAVFQASSPLSVMMFRWFHAFRGSRKPRLDQSANWPGSFSSCTTKTASKIHTRQNMENMKTWRWILDDFGFKLERTSEIRYIQKFHAETDMITWSLSNQAEAKSSEVEWKHGCPTGRKFIPARRIPEDWEEILDLVPPPPPPPVTGRFQLASLRHEISRSIKKHQEISSFQGWLLCIVWISCINWNRQVACGLSQWSRVMVRSMLLAWRRQMQKQDIKQDANTESDPTAMFIDSLSITMGKWFSHQALFAGRGSAILFSLYSST